jgi:hypothetical protein
MKYSAVYQFRTRVASARRSIDSGAYEVHANSIPLIKRKLSASIKSHAKTGTAAPFTAPFIDVIATLYEHTPSKTCPFKEISRITRTFFEGGSYRSRRWREV